MSSGDGQSLSNRRALSRGVRPICTVVRAFCSAAGAFCSDVRAFSLGIGAIRAARGANCQALRARRPALQEKSSVTGAFLFALAVDYSAGAGSGAVREAVRAKRSDRALLSASRPRLRPVTLSSA